PHDEAVARESHQRPLEPEPREAPLAGRQLRALEDYGAGHDLAGSRVQAYPIAALERTRRVRQHLEHDVHQRRGRERPRVANDVATLDRRTLEALQIDRGALAGHRPLDRVTVGLQPANLGHEAARKDFDAIVHTKRAGG